MCECKRATLSLQLIVYVPMQITLGQNYVTKPSFIHPHRTVVITKKDRIGY